ncbi:MAG: hypothetical protein QGI92_00285 [Dehalococcoidales bacterium]|jgi:hypothetical protein|nr:hypothetical protein [Dehalococcoidales bacterium]MDP7110005.1 hypothetical protein [Dehalococcoidales bacterium]MDP7310320.1 hypothetical protein [Dehalococcoidales bacterium]MDP7409936.1 hypothetical protein [Dehalococcoidales bacterium]MDP7675429.1 hypothetical protein [Dehalococcoidales bacterium]|tara:strand:- start:299 stop:457 length:159 start_codon:yes stop_codon:yes gene_type:complete
MGRRDFRHHETKKPKKDTKKALISTIQRPQSVAEVEVIGKRKRKEREMEGEI